MGTSSGIRDISIPFNFKIPDQILPPYNSELSTFDTPPSICISRHRGFDSHPIVYAHCYVSYRIRCQTIIDDRVVGEVVQPFKLYRISDVGPPLCVNDFPGEYLLSDQRTLSSFLKVKRHFHLMMKAREPKPILISKAHPSTTIDIHSRLLRYKDAYPDVIPIPVSGQISIVIKSETIFSVTPCSQVPTSLEATNSVDMVKSSAVHLQCTKRLTLSEFSPAENSVPGN